MVAPLDVPLGGAARSSQREVDELPAGCAAVAGNGDGRAPGAAGRGGAARCQAAESLAPIAAQPARSPSLLALARRLLDASAASPSHVCALFAKPEELEVAFGPQPAVTTPLQTVPDPGGPAC